MTEKSPNGKEDETAGLRVCGGDLSEVGKCGMVGGAALTLGPQEKRLGPLQKGPRIYNP